MTTTNQSTVGYLGPFGTHSHDVCSTFYPLVHWNLAPYSTIDACIRATASKSNTECIVPIENSLEGSVNITLDTLAHEVNLFIIKEIVWPIRHHLLTNGKEDDIQVILSHPQALAQCRKYLATNYPKAQIKTVESTAEAARLIASGIKNHAAIANINASKIYNLTVTDSDIQDHPHNCTRFVMLGHQPTAYTGGDWKTSIVCRIKGDKPGSLFHLLEELALNHINLVRIESRPARTELGEYIFFMDMEGSMEDENVKTALTALKTKSLWFKNLGSYPVVTQPKPQP